MGEQQGPQELSCEHEGSQAHFFEQAEHEKGDVWWEQREPCWNAVGSTRFGENYCEEEAEHGPQPLAW